MQLALLPAPFVIGQRVEWSPEVQTNGFGDREYFVAQVLDLGDRWRIHAKGPKDSGRSITATWDKDDPPRIRLVES